MVASHTLGMAHDDERITFISLLAGRLLMSLKLNREARLIPYTVTWLETTHLSERKFGHTDGICLTVCLPACLLGWVVTSNS